MGRGAAKLENPWAAPAPAPTLEPEFRRVNLSCKWRDRVIELPGLDESLTVEDVKIMGGGGTPTATPRRSLFASDVDAKEPAARPWFATSTAPQNVPPPKQKSTTQSVLEAVGLAAPEPEPEPKSRTRAVLEATGLVSPAPEPKEESASYF